MVRATGRHPGTNFEGKAQAVAEFMCKDPGKEQTGQEAGDKEPSIQRGWEACANYTGPVSPRWGPALPCRVVVIVHKKKNSQHLVNLLLSVALVTHYICLIHHSHVTMWGLLDLCRTTALSAWLAFPRLQG